MKIEIEIADEDVRDVFERFTQSLSTWCKCLDWVHDVAGPERAFVAWEDSSGAPRTAWLDLERGLRMMVKRHEPQHRPGAWESPARGIDPGGWNAEQCDAFVQYAAFGELRYV